MDVNDWYFLKLLFVRGRNPELVIIRNDSWPNLQCEDTAKKNILLDISRLRWLTDDKAHFVCAFFTWGTEGGDKQTRETFQSSVYTKNEYFVWQIVCIAKSSCHWPFRRLYSRLHCTPHTHSSKNKNCFEWVRSNLLRDSVDWLVTHVHYENREIAQLRIFDDQIMVADD